jgi:hypothetical protein
MKRLLAIRKDRREELLLQLFELTRQEPGTALSLSVFAPKIWSSLAYKLQKVVDGFGRRYEDEAQGFGPFHPSDLHLLASLVGGTQAARLLSFHHTVLGVHGMQVLNLHLDSFAGIHRLILRDASLDDKAASVLASCLPRLPQLDAVDMRDNAIGTEGITALLTHLALSSVLEVDLSGNVLLTKAGANAILRSRWAHSRLQKLKLPPISRGSLPCMLPLLFSPGLQELVLCDQSPYARGYAPQRRRQSRCHLPSKVNHLQLVAPRRVQQPIRSMHLTDHNTAYSAMHGACPIQ